MRKRDNASTAARLDTAARERRVLADRRVASSTDELLRRLAEKFVSLERDRRRLLRRLSERICVRNSAADPEDDD